MAVPAAREPDGSAPARSRGSGRPRGAGWRSRRRMISAGAMTGGIALTPRPCAGGSRRRPPHRRHLFQPQPAADRRVVGPQERVGLLFQPDGRRQSGFAARSEIVDGSGAGGKGGIVRVDGERKAGVRLGVFVAAIDGGAGRQRLEPGERRPHLLEAAFEHPAAAKGKQRVAGKQHLIVGEVPGDMAHRVAGRVDDVGPMAGKVIALAGTDGGVERRKARRIGRVADDRAAPLRLQSATPATWSA
jgi:hypothetical protein